jgi:tetratricopeptide (TPR) repeat protein
MLVTLSLLIVGCSKEPQITTHSQQALQFYKVGVAQWEKFYYPEAQYAFDEAIRLDSNFAMAWARRAMVAEGTQNHAKARQDIAASMSLLGSVTEYEQMFIRLQNDRLNYSNSEAAALADSMLKLYPNDRELHLIQGNLYEMNKNVDDAIRSYRRAIRIDTSYALAVMSLGYAYSSIGEQEKAVDQMERYIRMVPDAADPRASFADILMRVGRYDEALDQYKKSLELKPDYWYSANQIGGIYAQEGRLKKAAEQFQKGMESLPESQELKATHLAINGELNILRGAFKEAVAQFEEALRIDSLNSEAAYGLVIGFRKLKEFKRAHEVIGGIHAELERRNLLSSQHMLKYNLAKSRLLLDEGEFAGARALCDTAFEYTTALTRGPVFQQIAEIDLRSRQYEGVFDACEEALRVNPNYPEALFTLTKAYHARGDSAMTREIGGRLLDFWKNADPDYVNLQDLRKLLGTKSPASLPAGTVSGMVAAQS